MSADVLGGISVLLAASAYLPYMYKTIKGTVRPHPFSWLVWSILSTITAFIQLEYGAGSGAWLGFAVAIGTGIIFLLSLKNKVRPDLPDWLALTFSLSAIPIWLIIDNPTLAILIVVLIDNVIFLPTIRKAYRLPFEESTMVFVLSAAQYTFSAIAIENVNFHTFFYPTTLILTNILTVILILYRRKLIKQKQSN